MPIPVPVFANYPNPTLEDLLNHERKFGLDLGVGWRGAEKRYGSYKTLSQDPLVEVGRTYLNQENYVALIEGIGYGQWREQAAADWEAFREERESDD